MKNTVVILLALLAFTGCSKKSRLETSECNFQINITQVSATKVYFEVVPDNVYACYLWWACTSDSKEYDLSKEELARQMLSDSKISYEVMKGESDVYASFADAFLFRGKRTFTCKSLMPDAPGKIVLAQVNPNTREIIGEPVEVRFTTTEDNYRDMTFRASFQGTVLTIIPSDPSRTYFWDYISERQAEDDFTTLYLYYYNLVYMYEDYGFMAGLCKKGTDSFDLSQDANIVPGVKYYLVISAYEEGEISSDLTFYNFVYYPEGCVMEED